MLYSEMGEPQTPSLDHMMSGGYFQSSKSMEQHMQSNSFSHNGAATQEATSSQSSATNKPDAPSISEPSYFPPVETLLPKRRNSNSALGSPATLSVTTPSGDEANPSKRSHSTVERSSGSDLDDAMKRLSSLGFSSGEESALSLEDGPDPNELTAGSGNRRASLYENKTAVIGKNTLEDADSATRRASFEDNASKRKERVDFGKSIWS